jgi:hypothetical protein
LQGLRRSFSSGWGDQPKRNSNRRIAETTPGNAFAAGRPHFERLRQTMLEVGAGDDQFL